MYSLANGHLSHHYHNPEHISELIPALSVGAGIGALSRGLYSKWNTEYLKNASRVPSNYLPNAQDNYMNYLRKNEYTKSEAKEKLRDLKDSVLKNR